MKISVIIPVYNGEKTIKKCIDSVLAQTYEDIEIIVVNDGSTDSTAEILSTFRDKIKVINQPNMGQGAARNAGIAAAAGEYLGFVDADDTILPNMYKIMHEAAEKNGSQIVQCGITDIISHGDSASIRSRAAFRDNVVISDRAYYICRYVYKNKHTNEVCNKLIQKRFLEENNLKFSDTDTYFSEDFKLNLEMILHLERISFTDRALYNYNIAQSGHFQSGKASCLPKMQALFTDVLKNDMDSDTRKSLERLAALTMLIYCRIAADFSPEEAKFYLNTSAVKKYIKTSMTYQSNIKHFLLYFAILHAPSNIKLSLLNKFMNF